VRRVHARIERLLAADLKTSSNTGDLNDIKKRRANVALCLSVRIRT
jgi:hypothetical protein